MSITINVILISFACLIAVTADDVITLLVKYNEDSVAFYTQKCLLLTSLCTLLTTNNHRYVWYFGWFSALGCDAQLLCAKAVIIISH